MHWVVGESCFITIRNSTMQRRVQENKSGTIILNRLYKKSENLKHMEETDY